MPVPPILAEAALRWAEQGFFVFPCLTGAKAPAFKGGYQIASRDPAQIAAWWAENPSFNIGLSLGASGHCALDIDPPLGADTLAGLELEHELLPITLTVRTPRGGLHYIFKGELPPSASRIGPKIDTRGTGSYILAAPSVVGGNPYVIESDHALADLPEWVAACLRVSAQTIAAATADLDTETAIARARETLARYVEANDVAIEGAGGNDRTYRLACELLDLGLSPGTAQALVEELWNPHCLPAWSEFELEIIFSNANDYHQNEIGAYAVEPAATTFAALVQAAGAPKRSRFYPRDLVEQKSRKPPPWLIQNLIPRNATAILFGPSGSFKSFIALDLALALALRGTTALYVAGEMGIDLETKRVPAWQLAHNAPDTMPFFAIDCVPAIKRPQEVIELIEQIQARNIRPDLIVLDTVAKATRGMNENDAKDMGEFMEGCDTIKRAFGCSVLAVHHTGKDNERGARGSSLLFADADTVLETKAVKSVKAVELWVRKQKDAPESETPLTFEGKTLGPSLVFFPTDAETHHALTHQEDYLARKNVGTALKNLNAIGEDRAVTTQVLATTLLPIDRPDEADKLMRQFILRLRKLANGELAGYATGEGRDLVWSLPAA